MKTPNIKPLKKITLVNIKRASSMALTALTTLTTLAVFSGIATAVHAQPTGYDQLSFSTQVSDEITNDEVQASLYKKAQATTAKDLATQLNAAINQAMLTAKRYPSITVSTGQQNTYPRYDDNHQIIGWTGEAYVQIKSGDMNAVSQLIAQLQDNLLMGDIHFTVSKQRQNQIETQLKERASKAFQEQANHLARTWGASGYRLISVTLTSNTHQAPVPIESMYSLANAQLTAVPTQEFESGNSVISVIADGKIELVR